ncbi:MAG TPA: PEP-CTERM sorting domain-containing protein [Candidatus Methylacidiphilales bacterium]|jgi:hypothetical protein|nr:PEP-CTERM sorting domain-containing protein [Candidatus Methylacidiphilales bacterium]
MKQHNQLICSLALLIALASGVSVNAQIVGTYGYGIELLGTGSGALYNGQLTLYALDQGGGTDLIPSGSTATLSTAWNDTSTASSPTFNLGTFTSSDSLTLTGGSLLTFQNSGATVNTGDTYLNYSVSAVGSSDYVPGVNLNVVVTDVGSTTGNTRFSTEAQSINLLAGLAPGTYELQTYGYADYSAPSGGGQLYENNGRSDFGAEFTVVTAPEPSTWVLMLGGGFALFFLRRFRRGTN